MSGPDTKDSPEPAAIVAAADIGRLLKGIEIPAQPAILAALQAELRSELPNAERIGRLIAQDVALSAGLLKIANSGLFAPARQVGTMAEALALLGIGQAFQWVTRELLRQTLASGNERRFERFWESAAYSAAVCAQLAQTLPGTSRQSARDFGLFRDCGIPILARRFAGYGETLRLANAEARHPFTRIEEQRHGTQHAVVGCLMARNWGVSAAVSEAILCHHDYTVLAADSGVGGEVRTLVAIGVLAEQVVSLHLGHSVNHEWEKGREHAAAHLGLSRAGLADLVDAVRGEIERRRALSA